MVSFDEISKKGNTNEILSKVNPMIELEFNPWINHIREEESPNKVEENDNLILFSIEISLSNENQNLVKSTKEFEALRKILIFSYLQFYQIVANSFECSKVTYVNKCEVSKKVKYQWKNKRKKNLNSKSSHMIVLCY